MPEVAGDAAVLVDPLLVESIADGIRLLADESCARNLSQKGYARSQEFSWERTAQIVESAILNYTDEGPSTNRVSIRGGGRHVMELTAVSSLAVIKSNSCTLIYVRTRRSRTTCGGWKNTWVSGVRVSMRLLPAGVTFMPFSHYEGIRHHGPFDLLHCHSTKAGLIGRVSLAGRCQASLYAAPFSRCSQSRASPSGLWRCSKGVVRLCDRIIVVSREEYAHALDLAIPSQSSR